MKTEIRSRKSIVGLCDALFPVCLGTMLLALCLSSGCSSVLVTSLHNQNVQARAHALQFRADNLGAAFLIDVLNLQGYLGAWKEHPWAMTTATMADACTVAAIGIAIDESRSSSASHPAGSSPSAIPSSQPNDLRTGEGGDINLYQIYGSGNTIGNNNGSRP